MRHDQSARILLDIRGPGFQLYLVLDNRIPLHQPTLTAPCYCMFLTLLCMLDLHIRTDLELIHRTLLGTTKGRTPSPNRRQQACQTATHKWEQGYNTCYWSRRSSWSFLYFMADHKIKRHKESVHLSPMSFCEDAM